MRYICIEMTDRTTGARFWFCKNVPGWKFPGGTILKTIWHSFAARRQYPFERYDMHPHLTQQPLP